jgi:hypothetical protein
MTWWHIQNGAAFFIAALIAPFGGMSIYWLLMQMTKRRRSKK